MKPPGGSLINSLSTSPGFILRVLALPRNVAVFGSCGAGGPGGTPLVCRKEKFTGSSQPVLQEAKLNVHSRLSMVSAEHHCVLLQLSPSMNGVNPGA